MKRGMVRVDVDVGARPRERGNDGGGKLNLVAGRHVGMDGIGEDPRGVQPEVAEGISCAVEQSATRKGTRTRCRVRTKEHEPCILRRRFLRIHPSFRMSFESAVCGESACIESASEDTTAESDAMGSVTRM